MTSAPFHAAVYAQWAGQGLDVSVGPLGDTDAKRREGEPYAVFNIDGASTVASSSDNTSDGAGSDFKNVSMRFVVHASTKASAGTLVGLIAAAYAGQTLDLGGGQVMSNLHVTNDFSEQQDDEHWAWHLFFEATLQVPTTLHD